MFFKVNISCEVIKVITEFVININKLSKYKYFIVLYFICWSHSSSDNYEQGSPDPFASGGV